MSTEIKYDQTNEVKLTEASQNTIEDLPKSSNCLLYTSPSPRDRTRSRMPSSA